MSKKHTVFSNISWKFFANVITQVMQVVISIILARLIVPEYYGSIAIVLVIISFSAVFVDCGLGSALIQQKKVTGTEFSSVFYINIAISFIIYLLLFFTAPLITRLYGEGYEQLTLLIRWIGINIIILSLNSVQHAYIARNMLFKKEVIVTFFVSIITGALCVYLAYSLPSEQRIWVLAVQSITSVALKTIGLWIFIGWRPKLAFSREAVKSLFQFAWKVLLKGILNVLIASVRKLFIGKMYTASELAFYSRGDQYPRRIASTIDNSISAVLFPVFSAAQNDISKLKQMIRRALQVSTYLTVPLLVGFCIVADKFVLLLLTETWLPAVPYIRVFCLAFIFKPITGINFRSILALGRSDISLKCEIIRDVASVIILLITIWHGVLWIAIGVLIVVILELMIYYIPNRKLIDYSVKELFGDVKPTVLLTLGMSIFIILIGYIEANIWLSFALQICLGAGFYIGMSYITKNKSFMYLLGIIADWFARKHK